MTATIPQYAKPIEEMEWMMEETPSSYVVPLSRVRTLVAHELPYECKFYVSNAGDEAEMAEADIAFHKVEVLEEDLELYDQTEDIRMETRSLVLSIANYQDDWDGYGAIRPLSECLSHALDIIGNSHISLNNLSDIYPNPNGTITIEWEQNGNEIGLELGNREFSYYVHIGDLHSYNNKKQYNEDEIAQLAEYVSFLG